jgi:hypothetical protein
MDQDGSEITEQVIKFLPKQQSANPTDEAGQAVIAQIRKAAQLANENLYTCARYVRYRNLRIETAALPRERLRGACNRDHAAAD